MPIVNFNYGSNVFYKGEKYVVIGAIGLDQVTIKHFETGERASVQLTELSSSPQAKNPLTALNDFTEAEWETAKKRFEIIKPLIGIRRNKKNIAFTLSQHKVSRSTLYKWLSVYESNPVLSSLISQAKKRGPKKPRLPEKTNDIIRDIVDQYYLQKQKPSFKRTYLKIKKACMDANTTIPSANTVRLRINAIDPMYSLKRRENHKTALAKYGEFPGEFKNGNYPLDVFQIDHTPLDIILVDDIRRLPIGRPYLTLAIDIYSRMVAGFFLSFQGPAFYNVGQCLYRCFLPKNRYLKKLHIEGEWPIYGVPRLIHVDNGAELVGTEVQRVCDEYGISIEKRPPGQPQYGGHIERALGTLNAEIHNVSGTTFSNITQKGSYQSEKNASLTLDELEKWLAEYIVNIYHKTYHDGIETTPLQRYRFGIEEDENNPQVGILPSMIEDEEHIRISLLPTFFRTVQRDGITLDDITYYDDRLRHFINRTGDDGNKLKLKIKRDPMDISRIYIFDPKLNYYFEVPYRRMSAPTMNIWELKAIKRFLSDRKIKHYDENDIFRAYHNLEEIENNARRKTKSLRKQSQPKTPSSSLDKNTSQESSLSTQPRQRGFGNIEIYDVVEYPNKGDNQ